MLIKIIKQLYYHFKIQSLLAKKNSIDTAILKMNNEKVAVNKKISKLQNSLVIL